MSDLSFLGADGATEDTSKDSRKKLLLAGVGGVAVLALVGTFVVMPMLSSGEEDTAPLVPKKKAPAAAAKAPAAKAPAKAPAAKELPKTYDEDFQRDPFKPLYVESSDRGAGVAAPGSGTGAVPAPPAPAAPAPAAGGTSANVGGNRVALMDVFVRSGKTYAQTKVGSTVHTPPVGATFATTYRLLSASGTCATYQYGDEQFQLCEGQEVLK